MVTQKQRRHEISFTFSKAFFKNLLPEREEVFCLVRPVGRVHLRVQVPYRPDRRNC